MLKNISKFFKNLFSPPKFTFEETKEMLDEILLNGPKSQKVEKRARRLLNNVTFQTKI